MSAPRRRRRDEHGRTRRDRAGDFDRSIMPPPAAEPKFSLPPIRRGRLKNGMEVLLVEKHQLPLVNIHLVFPVGRWQDPADKPGLCSMMTALWDEGTERRSSEEIAAQLAGIGASLSISTDWDTTSRKAFHPEAAAWQGAGHLCRRAAASGVSRGGVATPAGGRPGPLAPDPKRAGRVGRHGGPRAALRAGASLRPAPVRQRQDAAGPHPCGYRAVLSPDNSPPGRRPDRRRRCYPGGIDRRIRKSPGRLEFAARAAREGEIPGAAGGETHAADPGR